MKPDLHKVGFHFFVRYPQGITGEWVLRGIAPRFTMRNKNSIFMFVRWVLGPAIILVTCIFITHFIVVSEGLRDLKRASRLHAKSLVTDFRATTEGQALYKRARIYADLSQRTHLLDGMVVDRDASGNAIHECDSLLFSSLRYVALAKLGFVDLAVPAWEAIKTSRTPAGGWLRHPRCPQTPLSRDMTLGLLVSLSQNPPDAAHMLELIREDVHRFDGYISNGPFYLSYFSPGFRAAFDEMAMVFGQPSSGLPMSFWTTEFDAWTADGDYRSHLVALTVWLEYEIERMATWEHRSGSMIDLVGLMVDPLANIHIRDFRLQWSAQSLLRTDPDNLFFRWLAVSSIGGLTIERRAALAKSLLAMPAFPEMRLPKNCDRRADYIWQRPSVQTRERSGLCTEIFSGTDFLWISAMLLEND